jgi:hypothetical protein
MKPTDLRGILQYIPQFSDPQRTNYPNRFYRIRSP